MFDGVAIKIARPEIHVLEGASGLENVIDQADALEQLRPIDVGDEAHAGDDVAHRDAGGDLPLVLVADDGVGGRPPPGQLLVEPLQRRCNAGILIAQPMDQLHEKTIWERRLCMRRKHRLGWFGDAASSPQQPVRHDVRGPALGPAVGDALGDPPEVLDEHDAQSGRHRPQFANGQRLHHLIGAQVTAQDLRVE